MYSFNQLPAPTSGKELQGLYVLKFICAIMVVQIHTYSVLKPHILPLCRIAVPVFFIISGYFMVSDKGVISSTKILKTFVKTLRITIFATIAYMAYDILLKVLLHHSLDSYFQAKYWVRELLFGTSARGHLWYLTAYLQSLLVMYVLLKIKRFPWLFLAIPIGIALNLLIGSYGFLLFNANNSLLLSRNVITIAIPCLLTGILIRTYEAKLPSQTTIYIGLILAIALLYLEERSISHSAGDIILMTMPVAILTFIAFLRHTPRRKYSVHIAQLGKKHATNIYLWHLLIASIYYILQYKLHLNFLSCVDTFAIALLTLLISMSFDPTSIPDKCRKLISRTRPISG